MVYIYEPEGLPTQRPGLEGGVAARPCHTALQKQPQRGCHVPLNLLLEVRVVRVESSLRDLRRSAQDGDAHALCLMGTLVKAACMLYHRVQLVCNINFRLLELRSGNKQSEMTTTPSNV